MGELAPAVPFVPQLLLGKQVPVDQLFALERAIHAVLASGAEPATFATAHHFGNGIYMREMFLGKGDCAVGKLHKLGHVFAVARGEATIVSPQGSARLKAPAVFTSPPGTKRAAYAHADTVFVTIHEMDETDVAKVEALCVTDIEPDVVAGIGEDAAQRALEGVA